MSGVDVAGLSVVSLHQIPGNVLLWVRGPVTLRLEGKLTKAQALELAQRLD